MVSCEYIHYCECVVSLIQEQEAAFFLGRLHSKCNVQSHHVIKLSNQISLFVYFIASSPYHVTLDVATHLKNAVHYCELLPMHCTVCTLC